MNKNKNEVWLVKVDDIHQCTLFSKIFNRCAKVLNKLVPICRNTSRMVHNQQADPMMKIKDIVF